MGKLGQTVKSEIIRLAKREIHQVLVPLTKELRLMKNSVSQIRKTVLALERITAPFRKELETRAINLEATPEEMKIFRFSPRIIQSIRKHLGITQKELAILTGVSVGAVQKWEAGNFRPADNKRVILVALRKLRRRDVKKLLEKRTTE